jgi:hypothetical protein
MKNYHFFVCRNGYGHQKRVFSVVAELVKYSECSIITIHCNKETFIKTNTWDSYNELLLSNKVQFEFELMQNAPNYFNNFTITETKDWLEYVKNNNKIKDELVIIDNDISLLSVFSNAIIMGSFFWKDIINPLIHKDLIEFEKKLLIKNNPRVIGVDAMAMNNVKSMPNFLGLPWFINNNDCKQNPLSERNEILISGGGTGIGKIKFLELALELLVTGEKVYVDGILHDLSNAKLPLFSFKENDFCKLKAVVCRPGMGILNDCVSFGIPIFAVEDVQNSEILHNAVKIEELGLGIKVSDSKKVIEILKQNDKMELFHNNLLRQEVNGAALAAEFLIYGR